MPEYEFDAQYEEDLKFRPASLDIKFAPPLTSTSSRANTMRSPLKLFNIAKSENRTLYVAAPMIKYSKVGFL